MGPQDSFDPSEGFWGGEVLLEGGGKGSSKERVREKGGKLPSENFPSRGPIKKEGENLHHLKRVRKRDILNHQKGD